MSSLRSKSCGIIPLTGSRSSNTTCLFFGRCNSEFCLGNGSGSSNSTTASSGKTGPTWSTAETSETLKRNVKPIAQETDRNDGGEKHVVIMYHFQPCTQFENVFGLSQWLYRHRITATFGIIRKIVKICLNSQFCECDAGRLSPQSSKLVQPVWERKNYSFFFSQILDKVPFRGKTASAPEC